MIDINDYLQHYTVTRNVQRATRLAAVPLYAWLREHSPNLARRLELTGALLRAELEKPEPRPSVVRDLSRMHFKALTRHVQDQFARQFPVNPR